MIGLTANETCKLGAQVIELPHRRSEFECCVKMIERVMLPLIMDEDVDLNRPRPINQCEGKFDAYVV